MTAIYAQIASVLFAVVAAICMGLAQRTIKNEGRPGVWTANEITRDKQAHPRLPWKHAKICNRLAVICALLSAASGGLALLLSPT